MEIGFPERTLEFRIGGDGERLVIQPGPWVDPFASPLPPENAEWVRMHGKLEAVDVFREPGWSSVVGEVVASADPPFDDAKLVGATITVGAHVIEVRVGADELLVDLRRSSTDGTAPPSLMAPTGHERSRPSVMPAAPTSRNPEERPWRIRTPV